MKVDRRRFLKVVASGTVLSFIPISLSTVTTNDILSSNVITNREAYSLKVREILGIKRVEWGEMPYKVDWDKFELPSAYMNAFVWGGKNKMSMSAKRPDNILNKKPGLTILDYAFRDASWLFNHTQGEIIDYVDQVASKLPDYWIQAAKEFRDKVTPEEFSTIVKKVAYLYGASLVGIAPLNEETRKLGIYKEHQDKIPDNFKSVIVMAFEMDYDAYETSNAGPYGAAVGRGYSQQAIVALLTAYFLKLLGYEALPHAYGAPMVPGTQKVGDSLSVFWGIRAGLGEQGRLGLLITPEYGPRIRISKVFTNAELVPDKPIRFGVWEFCQECKKCAETCPSGAIPMENAIAWEGPTECEEKGIYKYQVNHQKCYSYWCEIGFGCGICVRACPFNKRRWWAHETFRDIIGPTIGGQLSKALDDFLGYGEQLPPEEWWGKESGYREIFG